MPKRSIWRGATFDTIRRQFIKIACRVEEKKTRIKLALAANGPRPGLIAAITAAITAQAPWATRPLCRCAPVPPTPTRSETYRTQPPSDRPDHAQYIANWLQLLRDDPKAIFTAAAKASQAVAWLKGRQGGS